MKIAGNLFCLLIIISIVCGAPMPEYDVEIEPFELIAIGPSGEQTLEEISRIKRSGSGDFFGQIKNKITSGIKSKFASFSQISSPQDDDHHGHFNPYDDVPHSYDEKSFDWWSLKKSVLNTLLQAVKAIKGGVIAIKGQLIKGGGQIISTKGKIISAKGEAISNLGRHIASSALLVNPQSSSGHGDHQVSSYSASGPSSSAYSHSGGSAPSAPAISAPSAPIDHSSHGFSSSSSPNVHYGAPSIPPSGAYGPPIESHLSANVYGSHKYQSAAEAHKGTLPEGYHAGLVIVKPIYKTNRDVDTQKSHSGIVSIHTDHHHSIDGHPTRGPSKPEDPILPFKYLPSLQDSHSLNFQQLFDLSTSNSKPTLLETILQTHPITDNNKKIPEKSSLHSSSPAIISLADKPNSDYLPLKTISLSQQNQLKPPAASYGSPIKSENFLSTFHNGSSGNLFIPNLTPNSYGGFLTEDTSTFHVSNLDGPEPRPLNDFNLGSKIEDNTKENIESIPSSNLLPNNYLLPTIPSYIGPLPPIGHLNLHGHQTSQIHSNIGHRPYEELNAPLTLDFSPRSLTSTKKNKNPDFTIQKSIVYEINSPKEIKKKTD